MSPGDGVCTCGGSGGSGGTCNYDDTYCKVFNMKGCDCCTDPNSKACTGALGSCCQKKSGGSSSGGGAGGIGNFLSILDCVANAQKGKPDPACFGSTACLNTACLTEFFNMGGGAGTSKKSKGYCSGQNGQKP